MLAAMNDGARAQDSHPIPVGQAAPLDGFRRGRRGRVPERAHPRLRGNRNALGGILGRAVEPYFEDTAQMGDATNKAVQRLIDRHGVHAVINGYNIGSGAAIQDVIADSGIIYVHYDTTIGHNALIASDPDRYFGSFQATRPKDRDRAGLPGVPEGARGTWRIQADQQQDGRHPVGRGLFGQYRERDPGTGGPSYGWEISLFETVAVPTSEWGPTLAKLRADPPAVIAVTHFLPADLGQFMVQFSTDPTPSLVYMQYGPSIPAFREIAGDASVGVLYATVVGALQDEIGTAFETRYKAKFGENAGHNSGAQPYDGCYLWLTAAALAGGTGEPDNAGSEPQGGRPHAQSDLARRHRDHADEPGREHGLYLSHPDQ